MIIFTDLYKKNLKTFILWYDKSVHENKQELQTKIHSNVWSQESHPGYKLSHLSKLKHSIIPRISLPQNKLCSLEELELQHTHSTEKSHDKQEIYAKMALLMFYSYWKLINFTDDISYWKKIIKNFNAIFSISTQNSGKRVLKYFKI